MYLLQETKEKIQTAPSGLGLPYGRIPTSMDGDDATTKGQSMNTAPKFLATLGDPISHGTSIDSAAILFSLLSNAVRLNVLLRVIHREWSVGELATDLNIGQSALSQHLTKLRRGGVVCSRRKRQTIYYSCNDAAVIGLLVEIGLTRPALHFDHGLPDTGELRASAS